MIKWSDKESHEEVYSRSHVFFEEIEEKYSPSSNDGENSMHDEGFRKSEKFDTFSAT